MANRRKTILDTPNRKIRKRRRIIRLALLSLFLLCLVCVGIFYFFRMKSLQVSEVIVTGATTINPEILIEEAKQQSEGYVALFVPRTFFLAYPRDEIAKQILERHKEINFAEVKLSGFNKGEIGIVERSPFAFYCTSLSCYVADEKGLVYEEASTTSRHVVFRDLRIESQMQSLVGSYPLSSEVLKDVEHFMRKLSDLNLHLKEAVIEENGDVTVATEEGNLLVSIQEPLDGQYEFLKTALSQEIFKYPDGAVKSFNYIDLRFGKKVFYKL